MPDNQKIKFAVVGYGAIGKQHVEMIINNPLAELVGIVDVRKEVMKQESGELKKIPFFTSIDDLFSAANVDVINICTPNGLHTEQCIKGLSNKSHVVCEKPMGLSRSNCEQVIFKALEVDRQVFCVMQNRYSPPAVWLKSIIDEKRLGTIHMVLINCFWNRNTGYYAKSQWKGTLKLDGGPLFTQFSHFVDIMYWLFGDIKDIKARFENFNHRHDTEFEDSGFINFCFTNGGLGAFNYSTSVYDKNLESSITILGERGSVKVGGQYMEKIEICNINGYEMPQLPPVNPPNDYGDYKGSAANHYFVIQNVIDTLLGDSTITTNALEGLKVVEIIERIYEKRKL